MIEHYPSSPNKLSKLAVKTAALAGAAALSLTGCVTTEASSRGYMFCEGSQSITVKHGDTLGGLLFENTEGVTNANVQNIIMAFTHTEEFRGEGDLPRVDVYNNAPGAKLPGITAGETIDIPVRCA